MRFSRSQVRVAAVRCLVGICGLQWARLLWDVPCRERVLSVVLVGAIAAIGIGAVWSPAPRILVGRVLHSALLTGLIGSTLLVLGKESWPALTLVALGAGASVVLALTWTSEWRVQADCRAALWSVPVLAAALVAFYAIDRRWGSEHNVVSWVGVLVVALFLSTEQWKSRRAQP